jgi:hypothetical protein
MRVCFTVALLVAWMVSGRPEAFERDRVIGGLLIDSASDIADFAIEGESFQVSDTLQGTNLQQCGPCQPGGSFSLRGTYLPVNDPEGMLRFNSSIVHVPDLQPNERAEITRRFTFQGRLTIDGVERKLVGQGTVTVTFFHSEGEGIFATRLRYQFEDSAQ